MSILSSWWRAFVALIFPPHCIVCDAPLEREEEPICVLCRASAPRTFWWKLVTNELQERLSRKVPIEYATAFFHYHQGQQWKRLIHRFKYQGRWTFARWIGDWYGHELAQSELYADVDRVIPIPLHPLKRMMRGYNQSELLAGGIARAIGARLDTSSVVRCRFTSPQMRKRGNERMKNIRNAFRVAHPEQLAGCHLLLVDDVLTSGSTMVACIEAIREQVPDCRISVAVLADVRLKRRMKIS